MEKPKLTRNFADVSADGQKNSELPVNLPPLIATFPASRMTQGIPITEMPNIPVAPPQREKVAIVGTAPSSRMLAPWNDPTWEIWACSPGNMGQLPRVDVWFEIHKNLLWPEHESYGKPYIEWLSKLPIPVYMQDQSYFPHAQTFPMKELVKEYGGNFFSSSFAWMMAYAIHKKYKEIALYGVDMASKDEYYLQRQAFYFWYEKAQALGIKVTIPPESDLAQPPTLYGYSEVTPLGLKMHARKQELLMRIGQIEKVDRPNLMAQLKTLEDTMTYLKGAVEDCEYVMTIWPRIGHRGEDDNG